MSTQCACVDWRADVVVSSKPGHYPVESFHMSECLLPWLGGSVAAAKVVPRYSASVGGRMVLTEDCYVASRLCPRCCMDQTLVLGSWDMP